MIFDGSPPPPSPLRPPSPRHGTGPWGGADLRDEAVDDGDLEGRTGIAGGPAGGGRVSQGARGEGDRERGQRGCRRGEEARGREKQSRISTQFQPFWERRFQREKVAWEWCWTDLVFKKEKLILNCRRF